MAPVAMCQQETCALTMREQTLAARMEAKFYGFRASYGGDQSTFPYEPKKAHRESRKTDHLGNVTGKCLFKNPMEGNMDGIARRILTKGAAIGGLAFSISGGRSVLTAREV
jgi:hypothetical protein